MHTLTSASCDVNGIHFVTPEVHATSCVTYCPEHVPCPIASLAHSCRCIGFQGHLPVQIAKGVAGKTVPELCCLSKSQISVDATSPNCAQTISSVGVLSQTPIISRSICGSIRAQPFEWRTISKIPPWIPHLSATRGCKGHYAAVQSRRHTMAQRNVPAILLATAPLFQRSERDMQSNSEMMSHMSRPAALGKAVLHLGAVSP